ncbi:MAG: aminomethyltransferase beta-barrel domain-containing protein, partial [Parvularculaceae bacterium]
DVSWLGDGAGEAAARARTPVAVKVRSTRPPAPARLVWDGGFAVDLDEAEEGVAPGQACVFYSPDAAHDRVLGGGWISATESAPNRQTTKRASIERREFNVQEKV